MIFGLYLQGNGFLHKINAKFKIIFLVLLSLFIFYINNIYLLLLITFLLFCFFNFYDGLGLNILFKSSKLLIVWTVFIFPVQFYFYDFIFAVSTISRIFSLVWLASLVTYTSRMDHMIDSFIFFFSWLRYFGVSLEKVAFILSMTIRIIPYIFSTYEEIKNIYSSRGINNNFINLFTPVLIRIIRDTNSVGLALSSRGYDSWGSK